MWLLLSIAYLRFTNGKRSFDLFYSLLIFLLFVDQLRNLLGSLVNLGFTFSSWEKVIFIIFRPVDTWPFKPFLFGKREEWWYIFNGCLRILPKFVLVEGVSGIEELIRSSGGGLVFVVHKSIIKLFRVVIGWLQK